MTTVTIVDATRRDAHPVAALIGTAFHSLDVAAWLVRDPIERSRVLYAHFRILVEHAFDYGAVHRVDDGEAVAVWLRRDRPLPDIPDYRRRRWLACGRYTSRVKTLDAAFDRHHPDQPHHHLAFLAVHPDRQGHGLGTALLAHYHGRLDRAGMPAYLEASSRRSRDLYLRHGYRDRGMPIVLPDDGPRLWPMWRPPVPQDRS